ncbi:hypothetical protein G6O69_10810 [Pseudenhygromyxa sp. WMMC2535]|uniref:hypothetical protein n=1 Tax=Pseudenhygromyxa sp. WMMC2535 TaxID=2712867 RepID=UPI0015570A3E|nr:hypothetical protein [Pseudenhygromyxa sp. WMMC2535]NVB38322.1 hypothetical protein [Pseudenhygromyxa sp. WMMC2535]
MDTTASRAIAGAALACALGLGGWTSSRLTATTEARAEVIMAKRVDPKVAQRQALAREPIYERSEAFYKTRVEVAHEHYEAEEGVPLTTLAALREPNVFFHPITADAPRTLAPGESLREAPLEISVSVQQLVSEARGIRSKLAHTVVDVVNTGEVPVAYRLLLDKAGDGDCRLRAMTRYDAMVLEPGERAEISVCKDSHSIEISELRVLELTPAGAIWVDKLPAAAVALGENATRAHDPGRELVQCTELPVREYAARIQSGELAWEDLIDFYSRHDCENYEWVEGYTRALEPLASLPVLAEDDQ